MTDASQLGKRVVAAKKAAETVEKRNFVVFRWTSRTKDWKWRWP